LYKQMILCFWTAVVLPVFGFGLKSFTLDGAIAESMDYITEKLPEKTKVAVLKVKTLNEELTDYISVECDNYIKDNTSLVLANKKQLPDILKHNNIADLNKASEEDFIKVAGLLGAKAVIFVGFDKQAGNYRFFIQMYDTETKQTNGMLLLPVELDGLLADFTGETYISPEKRREMAKDEELARVKKELEELKARTSQAHKIQENAQAQSVVDTKIINGIECVLVKAGTFMMGSPKSEIGRDDNETRHQMTITNDYWIGKYPITQAQYRAVTGSNPSRFSGDDRPVDNVNWNEAVAFCNAVGGRLPTEAEWEFAARGGNKSKGYIYSGSNDIGEVAWCWNNSSDGTKPVGTKTPNELGIYDMSGNVWMWCSDWYGSYDHVSKIDPNVTSGYSRVIRGGSWRNNAHYCRVAYRRYDLPSNRYDNLGFRVVFNAD